MQYLSDAGFSEFVIQIKNSIIKIICDMMLLIGIVWHNNIAAENWLDDNWIVNKLCQPLWTTLPCADRQYYVDKENERLLRKPGVFYSH